MPRVQFISALAVSVALIGGAMWFRFVRIPPYTNPVATVTQVESTSTDDLLLTDFFNTETSTSVAPTTELSQTDLIGRQLFTDYLELKSQGQSTPNDIDSFAASLAESIKNINVSIPKINANKIIVLPESETSLAVYGAVMTNIRNKYKNLVAAQTKSSVGDITNTDGPAFSIFMNAAGKLYKAAADELLLVGVPTSLAQNHLNLINQYLETAEVMKLISNASKDPLQAYAALNIYIKNSGREAELLLNIQKTLMAHGIIFNSI
ncbi:MAG: hypothetical protein HYX23_01885 [Candidatus Zambryskibacteria bacterium]|nr:hypothetical protein [Candidatus Zambryskibacteria bacterium]